MMYLFACGNKPNSSGGFLARYELFHKICTPNALAS
jgi:hypothetical protein